MKQSRRASRELRELAQLCGIQTFYFAGDNMMVEAESDVLMAVLRALGVAVERSKDIAGAVAERRLFALRRMMEPVLVVRSARRAVITVTLPRRYNAQDAWFTTRFEDGAVSRERLLADATAVETLDADGQTFSRYLIEYSADDTARLPLGYHSLRLEVNDEHQATATEHSFVIVAPNCPEPERGWGVFMPLHALRTRDDWGVGSYRDLARLGEWIAHEGGATVGGLPLYPTYLDEPIDPSPYRPVSRLAYNELYIDPTTLPELSASPSALELIGSTRFLARVKSAHDSNLVDYETVALLRRHVLEPLASTFFATPSPRRHEFEAFFTTHPELFAYGQFRAAQDQLGPDFVMTPDDVAKFPIEGAHSLNYHLYCQWAAFEQLSAVDATTSLYADLPVGVHPDGFDPYWSPQSFVKAADGGAPPDVFYEEGQDWGFPPLHPGVIRDDAYHYLRAVLSRALRHASYLRIDHVMGLQRLYFIPEGFDARHGAYVTYHADEMHAVVSLEAHRAGSVIVGEDLGTVPHEVRERMTEDHILRSWVFEFESTTEDPLPEVPTGVLASLATHDLPRFSSFLWAVDIDEAEKLGRYSASNADELRAERALYRAALFRALEIPVLERAELTNAARRGCEAHLAASMARLVLIDLEELWGEDEPQNRPGTVRGNWRHRGAFTLEEAQEDEEVQRTLGRVNDLRKLFVT